MAVPTLSDLIAALFRLQVMNLTGHLASKHRQTDKHTQVVDSVPNKDPFLLNYQNMFPPNFKLLKPNFLISRNT